MGFVIASADLLAVGGATYGPGDVQILQADSIPVAQYSEGTMPGGKYWRNSARPSGFGFTGGKLHMLHNFYNYYRYADSVVSSRWSMDGELEAFHTIADIFPPPQTPPNIDYSMAQAGLLFNSALVGPMLVGAGFVFNGPDVPLFAVFPDGSEAALVSDPHMGGGGGMSGFSRMAARPDGTRLFAVSAGGNGGVFAYDGQLVRQTNPTAPGLANGQPYGLAASNTRLYLSSLNQSDFSGANRWVNVYDADGEELLEEWGVDGAARTIKWRWIDRMFWATGHLYVYGYAQADAHPDGSGDYRLYRYTPDGAPAGSWDLHEAVETSYYGPGTPAGPLPRTQPVIDLNVVADADDPDALWVVLTLDENPKVKHIKLH